MQDDVIAIGDRDPRFAELDSQIKAEETARKQMPAAKKPKRQGSGPRLPREIRKEITLCARQLRHHRALFTADPMLRDRAARVLKSMLPPRRKRGRPGIASVTSAMMLLKKLQREHPEQERKQLWPQVYRRVIPNYATLPREQQRAKELLLREQVRSRRNQQRKRRTGYKR
jgi:hypothetical protein